MSTKKLSSLADVELRVEPCEEEAIFHNTELQHIYFILHMFLLPSLFSEFCFDVCATCVQLIEQKKKQAWVLTRGLQYLPRWYLAARLCIHRRFLIQGRMGGLGGDFKMDWGLNGREF